MLKGLQKFNFFIKKKILFKRKAATITIYTTKNIFFIASVCQKITFIYLYFRNSDNRLSS